jgi:hypothetical protein
MEQGPVRWRSLPLDLLQRIKAYKAILSEVELTTLDETIEDFTRDAHPEREIAVWEHIAQTYAMFLFHNPTTDVAIKHDIFSVLLMTSLDMDDWSEIRHLTPDQISHLVLNYRGLR